MFVVKESLFPRQKQVFKGYCAESGGPCWVWGKSEGEKGVAGVAGNAWLLGPPGSGPPGPPYAPTLLGLRLDLLCPFRCETIPV